MNLAEAYNAGKIDRFEMMKLAEQLSELHLQKKHITRLKRLEFTGDSFIFNETGSVKKKEVLFYFSLLITGIQTVTDKRLASIFMNHYLACQNNVDFYKFMPKRIFEKIGCSKKDMIRLLKSMSKLSIPNKAPNIKCNTLIICGEKEKDNINMKSAKQLNKVIKNSKFKIIENSGHEVNVDNPKKLANVIYDFWKDKDIK